MARPTDIFKDKTKEEYDKAVEDSEYRLAAARIILVKQAPFFGALASRLVPVPSVDINPSMTMGVMANGRLVFNPFFVNGMPLQQLAGCLAHESLHLCGDVFGRCQGRQGDLWNMAHDYAINPLVIECNLQLPEGLLIDDKFKEMSAEDIYEILFEEAQKSGKSKNRNKNNPLGDGQGGCADHNHPDNKEHTENGGITNGVPDGMTPEDWKAAIAEAAEYARQQGKLPAGLSRFVDDLFESVFDWKTVLARSIARALHESRTTWRKPSRRSGALSKIFAKYSKLYDKISKRNKKSKRKIGKQTYLPGRERTGMEGTIAIDTSGSIDEDLLKRFASETAEIMRLCGAKVTVYCCDAAIAEEIETTSIHEVKFKGGGGTSFIPVFQRIAERQQEKPCKVLIYFTDLMGSFPAEAPNSYPVLWLVPEQYSSYAAQNPPPFGSVLVIK